jgi:Amt family ammonium transporter
VIIGVVAGFLVVYSVFFFEARGVDDPVGAVSVHFVNGLWGVLSVGIFANGQYGAGWNGVDRFGGLSDELKKEWVNKVGVGYDGVRGILYGDSSQLLMQVIDCCVLIVFGFAMAYAWFKISNLITPLRVSRETEIAGLDSPEMGANSYPEFVREYAGAEASSGGGSAVIAETRVTGTTAMHK